ncbi:MAG: DEAD/DEAH box helicase, partial [Candidatus Micrarchaeales archaeon]
GSASVEVIEIINVYEVFLKKYKSYTEIQKKAMQTIANNENCIIIAPTGAGKTEAAVIPVLDRLLKDSDKSGIKLLYITPLRALNRDMIKRLEEFCRNIDVTISVRHGDTSQSERGKQARRAPMIMITTPETLQSILPTKSMNNALKNIKAVIVDEIHELYYNKRGAQLSIALERLEELAPNYQRIGISATVGNPELVKNFLSNGRDCKIVMIDGNKQIRLSVEIPKDYNKDISSIKDKFGLDDDSLARLSSIADHISKSKSTIIFGNTRQIVEALGSRLLYINSISPFGGIGVHHGSLDKIDRIEIENKFKTGSTKSIIATSSLELGIDIGEVDLVIQYGSPRQALRLIQRVGRSGHSEKGVSKGTIIAVNTVDAIEAVAVCENVATNTIERFKTQSNALDVLANQICGIALDKSLFKADDLLKIIRRSFAYKDFDKERLLVLLEFMNKQRMIGFDGTSISSGSRTRMYYYSHLSVIPDSRRYLVKSIVDNRIISSLDEQFVASNVDESSIFITKGLPWKVLSIDDNLITVEPSSDLEAAVPDWSGEDIPVSKKIVDTVFEIMNNKEIAEKSNHMGKALQQEVSAFVHDQAKVGLQSSENIMIEQAEDYKIIYTGLGTLANEALSRLVAHRMSAKLGKSINMKSSPYLIFFELGNEIDIKQVIKEISGVNLQNLIAASIEETEIFRYRFITVAKLFGIIDKESPVSKSIARRIMKVLHGSPVYEEAMRDLTQNYFDLDTLSQFLGKVNSGLIKFRTIDVKSLSPFSKLVLNSAYYTKELIMPLLPNDEIIESFSKFLLSKSIKLLCTYCGFNFARKLSEIRDEPDIKCPSCKSPMIVQDKDEYREIIERRQKGKRLGKLEQETFKEMMKQASLFSSYGGRAAVALSTYGVGPTSAARILMMLRRQEKFFYIDLIEAQKQFIKTKKYWSI